MPKTGLLQTMGAVALLAAAPAFAQTNTQPGDTRAGGAPNNPTANEAMPNQSGGTPHAEHMGRMHSGMNRHSARHASTSGRGASPSDNSADRLNEQSYQAAHNGQAFDGAGGMNGRPGGSMSDTGSSGGGPK